MAPIFNDMELKDRIKLVMESQHMTQQVFADFLQLSPATLSSIYTGRTRPGLNIVEAIKSKIPDISYDWLISGVGDMLISHPDGQNSANSSPSEKGQEMMINFDSSVPGISYPPQNNAFATPYSQGVKNTRSEIVRDEMKIVDKTPRKVTEIRVYYDDQTYETFVPAKNK